MLTYFIRHSSALGVDEATINALWEDDLIAIHYPHDNKGDFANGDSRSLDPKDYDGKARSALQRFHYLSKYGGYVFSTYRGKPGGKVGFIEPRSSVELFDGFWGDLYALNGRPAALKALKLNKAKTLGAEEAISLTAVQPRQGTFCCWRKVGSRVASIVEGVVDLQLGSLTPDLQEVMCMEYLRTEKAGERGLPVLRHTLMPVGRTMKDIDILGVSENGNVLCAQVTFSYLNADGKKLKKLDPYLHKGGETIYFCQCQSVQKANGHLVFPIQQVFDDFCKTDPLGKEWLRLVIGSVKR